MDSAKLELYARDVQNSSSIDRGCSTTIYASAPCVLSIRKFLADKQMQGCTSRWFVGISKIKTHLKEQQLQWINSNYYKSKI